MTKKLEPLEWHTVQKKISDLTEWEFNPRKITEEQVAQLKKSLEKFGLVEIPVIDIDGTIIAGHQRLKVLQMLGKGGESIDVRVPNRKLTEQEFKEYNVRSNRNLGIFDDELLGSLFEISELRDIGFTDLEIGLLFFDEKSDDDKEKDDIPEISKETQSILGDLYELPGGHRVLCGDSTKTEDFERLMNGRKADMVFTSPPYNANTKAGQGDIFNGKKSKKLYSDGYSDNLQSDDYVNFTQDVLAGCFTFTDGFIFWNVSYNNNSRYQYIQQIIPWLEYLLEQICWKKSSTIPFKGSMMRDWEPIYVFSTNKEKLGLEKVTSNFWEVSNTGAQQENHKACFPVDLVVKGIDTVNGCKLILDPFLGSGSTLIAAQKTGRSCYGMELDPKYIEVIITRYCNYVGSNQIIKNGKEITWIA